MRVCTLHTVIQPGCMMMIDTLNDTGSSATITPKDLSGGTMSPTPSHFILMSPLDCRCALSGLYPLQHPHARSRNSSVHIWSSSLQRHLDSGDIAGTRERGEKKVGRTKSPRALGWRHLLGGFSSPVISSGMMRVQLKCPLVSLRGCLFKVLQK